MLSKNLTRFCPGTIRTFKILSRSSVCAGVFILCVSGLDPVVGVRTQSAFNEGKDIPLTRTGAGDIAGIINLPTGLNISNGLPVISEISVDSITAGSAAIKWTTNVPANSRVIYGTTIAYGLSTLVDSTLVTSHSMILYSLAPGTLYHYQILSADLNGTLNTSADVTFSSAGLASSSGTLDTHPVKSYPSGKIVPWTANPTYAYDSVIRLAWNYLLSGVPNDPSTGKPAYYSRSYLNPNTHQVVNWDHNPAGLYGMLVESALKYYGYSGNADVMQLAINVATWHLDHGMTTANDNWPGVPYSEGAYGSLNYGGANQADGVGNLEPDKIGELGYAWLQLYKYNGNTRFRDAAIQAGNVLSSKVRTGTMSVSPWPFRVKASSGSIIENYCSNVVGPVSLLDGLIAAGLGNTAAYQTARTTAWNWMMNYPIQNNVWAQYFEDVSVQQNYNTNLNQYDANMTARYLLEHPEFDPNWEAHVRGIITWVENTFGQSQNGATIIKEQIPVFAWFMGSHTSRYASVNALLYDKTGDLAAKEKAYRSFNWATYMARSNGVVIDGPLYGSYTNANQWFTDGYGDYIRHFMTGLAAVPEWTPSDQTHLLRTSSLIKNISYGTNSVNYTTYDGSAVEVLHVNFNPVTITADGVPLLHRSDLTQPGWTLDVNTKALRIYHTGATQISISAVAASVNPVCPGGSTYFSMPKPGEDYVYQWQIDSTGTGFVDITDDNVYSGAGTDTMWLTRVPASYYGFTYRCMASKTGTSVFGLPNVLKFAAVWQGTVSSEWENAANWSCNYVPDGFIDVIIPGGMDNNPVIRSDCAVHGIRLLPGSVLTVNPGILLDIKGK
jgi:hypothetical protein